MPINPEAVGAQTGPFQSQWTEDDCLRYALTVGACQDDPLGSDLRYTTENTKGVDLQALPTMSTVLGGVLNAASPLSDIGDYDRRRSVHGSVEVILHRPLPRSSTVTSTVTVEGIHDKKSGALVTLVVKAVDAESSDPLFDVRNGIFVRGEGGWGGPSGPPWAAPPIPEREADAVARQTPRPEQPLLFRLNGDRNPLHSDPAVARAAGFDRPIMHGLCTFGFVGRALVQQICGGDPSRLAAIGCRFASPAVPGQMIETSMWKVDNGAVFITTSNGTTVLSGGYVTLRNA